MSKKKSFMNIKSIISEGIFDNLLKYIKLSTLKKNKPLLSKISKLNKSTKDLEDRLNKELRSLDPKAKPFKFKKHKLKDFI